MSTVFAFGKKGAESFFAENRTEVIEKENKRIMVDALIFNRDELVSSDVDESLSDASLLYSLVERDGFDILKKINGDFAGVEFDESTGIWTLFRDHLGVRPLYYYNADNLLVVASDMRDIVPVPGVHLKIDERQLWLKLAGYNDQTLRNTEFLNIRCVCPGSYTMFVPDNNGYKIKEIRYFKPGMNKVRLNSDEEYIAEMRRLVEDAVSRRVAVIDGTAGAELSGGLDSSVIDILVSKTGKPLKCVSWRNVPDDWPLQPGDERIIINDICEQEKIECEFTPVYDSNLEESMEVLQPPFANTPTLGMVAEIMNKKGIRYVFSGQGGDEGVSHRCNVLELWRAGEYSFFFHELWFCTKNKKYKLLRFTFYFLRCILTYYLLTIRPSHSDVNCKSFLTEKFKKNMKGIKGAPFYFPVDSVEAFEYGGIRVRPETAAYQAEKLGVQFLYPFEDYRVFDFAVSIPRNLFLRNGVKRWIYRKAFDDIMPQTLREVNYKDTPSLRNFRHEHPAEDKSEKSMKRYFMDRLDRTMWSEYLDFSSLDMLRDFDDIDNEKELAYAYCAFENLSSILLIQKMIEKNEG